MYIMYIIYNIYCMFFLNCKLYFLEIKGKET